LFVAETGGTGMTESFAPLSLGFIGGGLSSAVGMTHYSACRLDGIWELSAGSFSRNKKVNKETGCQWHIEDNRLYDNWQELVENEKARLDAITILTHTPSHAEIIDYVLERNVPIICEKSITMDINETDRLSEQFDAKKHFLAAIFNYTGYPLIRELRARIEAGEFGKIQQVHIEMPQEGLIRPPAIAGKAAPPQNWRLKDGRIPTICLDLGVHMHHMITFLTNEEPRETFAEFGNYSSYRGLIDYVHMLLRFESDMKGSLWMTKTALGYRNGLTVRVCGEKAGASWYQMEPEELQISYLDGRKETVDRGCKCHVAGELRYTRFKAGHPAGFIEAFANLYADIAEALREFREKGRWDNPYVYGFEGAVKGLKLFEAAVKSYKQQKWISTEI
jgi:predicted dehydrogenase